MSSDKLRLLLYVFLLMLGSCHYRGGQFSKELKMADSMMEEHPDTALYVLQKIAEPGVMSAEEYAVYCLLCTQAEDLTGIAHTSDKMITVAVDYFKDTDNLPLKSKAYYYMARVKEDLGHNDEAEQSYLLALSAIEKTRNYKQTGHIYSRIGEFYLRQGKYNEAYSMQQKSYNNYLLAGKDEEVFPWYLIAVAFAITGGLFFFLVRYRSKLKQEKQLISKQEKQLNTTRQTLQTQKTELTLLKKELRTMKKTVYNAADVVKKVQSFNNLSVVSKEKPTLTEQEWNSYLTVLDETFGFVSHLRQTYHKLTDIDIRICALVREGISNVHISSLMGMTPETLARRQQRIRAEKMGQTGAPVSLEVLLRNISA